MQPARPLTDPLTACRDGRPDALGRLVALVYDELRALALPAPAVGAYLDRECGDDPALRDEVERLLDACGRANAFLEAPPSRLAAELLADLPVLAGRRVGPYVVTGTLGRGGMGVVYAAERDDGQFRQRVALKLVSHGIDSPPAMRRFLDERQILATLNHPGIARLLDGGVTDDGLPYFAMEYVDGMPIDRHCDARRLDVDARLRLFVDVCDAVQYAHQRLVVHRDLKPSNILVTADGAPKLLDFGIAKLLAPTSRARDEVATTARWLTPRRRRRSRRARATARGASRRTSPPIPRCSRCCCAASARSTRTSACTTPPSGSSGARWRCGAPVDRPRSWRRASCSSARSTPHAPDSPPPSRASARCSRRGARCRRPSRRRRTTSRRACWASRRR